MSNASTSTGSQLPPLPTGADLPSTINAMNDRLRRIVLLAAPAAAAAVASAVVTPAAVVGTAAGGQLILCKPGLLGIQSIACPLVSLPAAATPSALVVLLGQASVGGAFTVSVSAAGTPVGSVTLAAGAVSASVGGTGAIAANAVIVVAITAVGLTFPGSDLTVMVRF